jgi:hypothetical protein
MPRKNWVEDPDPNRPSEGETIMQRIGRQKKEQQAKEAKAKTETDTKKKADKTTESIFLLAKNTPKAFKAYQEWRKRPNLVNNREIPPHIRSLYNKELAEQRKKRVGSF